MNRQFSEKEVEVELWRTFFAVVVGGPLGAFLIPVSFWPSSLQSFRTDASTLISMVIGCVLGAALGLIIANPRMNEQISEKEAEKRICRTRWSAIVCGYAGAIIPLHIWRSTFQADASAIIALTIGYVLGTFLGLAPESPRL